MVKRKVNQLCADIIKKSYNTRDSEQHTDPSGKYGEITYDVSIGRGRGKASVAVCNFPILKSDIGWVGYKRQAYGKTKLLPTAYKCFRKCLPFTGFQFHSTRVLITFQLVVLSWKNIISKTVYSHNCKEFSLLYSVLAMCGSNKISYASRGLITCRRRTHRASI